jgi:hypothetical protein
MELPVEQLIIGIFALFGAAVTGAFSVYNTKISRKLNQVEKKTAENKTLTIGNDILDQLVPALERKDEALDKIAEILDNILRAQTLTAQQLKSVSVVLEQRCQALDLIKAIQAFEDSRIRQKKLDKLRDENALEGIDQSLKDIIGTFENGKNNTG